MSSQPSPWEAPSPHHGPTIPQNQFGGWKELRALPIFGGSPSARAPLPEHFPASPLPGCFFPTLWHPGSEGDPKIPLFTVPHTSRNTDPPPLDPNKPPQLQSDRKQPRTSNTASQAPLSHLAPLSSTSVPRGACAQPALAQPQRLGRAEPGASEG